MKKVLILMLSASLLSISSAAQVAINTDGSLPDISAMLDIKSLTKGMLLPRMTQVQRNAIASPATGLTVYQTDNIPGIYFNSGTSISPLWVIAGSGSFWSLTGNAGTTVGTNFLGTTDAKPLMFKANNQKAGYIDYASPFNTGFGYQSLNSTTGSYNSAFGYQALYSGNTGSRNTANGCQALYSNIEGYYNTATGFAALYSNTSGYYNTANGYAALFSNTTGNVNTASGQGALYYNTTGNDNTANGYGALNSNSTAGRNTAIGNNALLTQSYNNSYTPWNSDNVAVGYEALYSNQPTSTSNGIDNTAVGNYALRANTTGIYNTANGYRALYLNTTGSYNTATGNEGLYSNSTANFNTANGYQALYFNSTGTGNTAIGKWALYNNYNGVNNSAIGVEALFSNSSGSYNSALGGGTYSSNVAINNTTLIGYLTGYITGDNHVEIGNSSVGWIGGQVGWSTYSDERIKDNVTANVPGLSFITRLRPVTYNLNIHRENEMVNAGRKVEGDWSSKYDIEKIKMTGFIAQEVEDAAKAAGYDFSGVQKPANPDELYSLRYSDFVVPLVKAVQELNAKNEAQQLAIEDLKAKNTAFEARLIAIESKLSGK